MTMINVLRVATVVALVCAPVSGREQRPAAGDRTPYAVMAPLDQYLMERDAEIALARSAAPASISSDATVVVLGRQGYETAVEGHNGFVCAVERSWMSQSEQTEFWNPKVRGAICYNPPAARSVVPITFLRTKIVLAGTSREQMSARVSAAYAGKQLPPLEAGAMSYMMSKQAYLTDGGAHNMPHLMFYTPLMNGANWGADLPKSPVSLIPLFNGSPEPIDVFIVGTRTWSDGTPLPPM
jgi:hypothetical protein